MPLTEKNLIRCCQYIRNTGQSAVTCAAFDEDWKPIGAAVRLELIRGGYITEGQGKIALAPRGRALLEKETDK